MQDAIDITSHTALWYYAEYIAHFELEPADARDAFWKLKEAIEDPESYRKEIEDAIKWVNAGSPSEFVRWNHCVACDAEITRRNRRATIEGQSACECCAQAYIDNARNPIGAANHVQIER